jgi:hypothetical protein
MYHQCQDISLVHAANESFIVQEFENRAPLSSRVAPARRDTGGLTLAPSGPAPPPYLPRLCRGTWPGKARAVDDGAPLMRHLVLRAVDLGGGGGSRQRDDVWKRSEGAWQRCEGHTVEATTHGDPPTAVVVHGSRILACAGRGFGIRRRSMELRRAGRCSCGGWPTWWASSPEAMPADVEAGGDQRPSSSMVTDSSPLGGGSSCWRLQPHPFSLVEVHRRRSQSMAGVKTLLGDCRC